MQGTEEEWPWIVSPDSSTGNTRGDRPVNPVGDIERTVDAQGCDIVCRDRLCFACPLEHEQLRKNGHALEPYRKRPQNFGKVEAVIEYQRQEECRPDQEFNAESIQRGVIRRPVVRIEMVQNLRK